MNNLDITGLKKSPAIVDGLKQLLADYHIYYATLRGFHWNVKGSTFFALHEMFESLYKGVSIVIDDIAERLLQLDETPENQIALLAAQAKIVAKGHPESSDKMIEHTLEDMKYLISATRSLLALTDESGDDATNDLLMGHLKTFEKQVWMLNSSRVK